MGQPAGNRSNAGPARAQPPPSACPPGHARPTAPRRGAVQDGPQQQPPKNPPPDGQQHARRPKPPSHSDLPQGGATAATDKAKHGTVATVGGAEAPSAESETCFIAKQATEDKPNGGLGQLHVVAPEAWQPARPAPTIMTSAKPETSIRSGTAPSSSAMSRSSNGSSSGSSSAPKRDEGPAEAAAGTAISTSGRRPSPPQAVCSAATGLPDADRAYLGRPLHEVAPARARGEQSPRGSRTPA